jgi:hypothetical protein
LKGLLAGCEESSLTSAIYADFNQQSIKIIRIIKLAASFGVRDGLVEKCFGSEGQDFDIIRRCEAGATNPFRLLTLAPIAQTSRAEIS